MRYFKKSFALAAVAVAVGLGFAGTASAAPPHIVKVQPPIKIQPQLGGGYIPGGYIPGGYIPGGYIPGGYIPKPLPFPPRVDYDYVVFYKASIFSPVLTYGKFETLNGAQIAALKLERFGFPTKIVRVRDLNLGWQW